MMMHRLSLLLPLLLASASARTSIRRYLESNAPIFLSNSIAGMSSSSSSTTSSISPFGSGMDSPDMSCVLSMATDFDSCSAAIDSNGLNCVWCAMGGDLGGCVGSDIADIVNSAEIPHLHCGIKTLSDEDETFFDDLKSCVTKGDTYDACLGPSVTADGTACNWCVTVNEPYFASCFSEAFVSEAKELDAATDMLSSVVDCSPEAPKEVGAIADMHCMTDGNPGDDYDVDALAGVCSQTKDAQGNPCVIANLFGMIDVCVTDTQKSVLDYIVDQMGQMGITSPMSMMGGEPGLGMGNGEDYDFGEGEDAEETGDDADDADEAEIEEIFEEEAPDVYVYEAAYHEEASVSYEEDAPEDAEEVNYEEEEDEGVVESGQ